MSAETRCKEHPGARAGWYCAQCHSNLCLRCAYRRRVGHGSLIVCAHCGGVANPILVARAVQSLPSLLPGAIVYPFSQTGLTTMVVAGVVLGGASYLGRISGVAWAGFCVFAAFFVLSYMLLVVRTTATGYNEVPEAEDFSHVLDLVGSLLRIVLAMTVTVLPVTIYAAYFKTTEGLASYFTDPWVHATVVVGLVWAPMACIQAAANSPMLSVLNPVYAIGYMVRVFGDYLLASVTFWLLLGGTAVIAGLGQILEANVDVPVLPRLYATAVGLYLPLVAFRVLGLLLYVRGAELGYGAQREYMEPALGDAQPPPEPAAVVAPVMTVQDKTEGFQSFTDMEGTGFQTMADPASYESVPLGAASDDLAIVPIAATNDEDEFSRSSEDALERGIAARAQAAAQPVPTSEQASDQEVRAMAEAGRFDFVAQAYRQRLGMVSVLTAEELRKTAEAAAKVGDFDTAAHALRRLAHDFPGSALAPEALLDAGVLLARELGQVAEGQSLLDHLVAAYPQSTAAVEGRRVLKGGGS